MTIIIMIISTTIVLASMSIITIGIMTYVDNERNDKGIIDHYKAHCDTYTNNTTSCWRYDDELWNWTKVEVFRK